MGYTLAAGGVTYGVCCTDWDVTADSVTHWDEQEREETSLIFTDICAVESRTFSFSVWSEVDSFFTSAGMVEKRYTDAKIMNAFLGGKL